MVASGSLCEKCDTDQDLTEHHIFNYLDVKKKLLQIYPKPDTQEEHSEFQRKADGMHKHVPTLILCRKCHDEIEKLNAPIKLRSVWMELSSQERKRMRKEGFQ